MPEKETMERARRDKAEGKAASTQAGEFVREEFEHIREGKHGARSPQQAIAIGLSKARRAGVDLKAPRDRRGSDKVQRQAKRDLAKGRAGEKEVSPRRSRATTQALKKEGSASASTSAISRQARRAAARRGSNSRHNAAMKAVRTKRKERTRSAGRKTSRKRSRAR
jgi:hypothetical protein